jgi:hypothetical protein
MRPPVTRIMIRELAAPRGVLALAGALEGLPARRTEGS